MHALSASQLIDLWERGQEQPATRRALLLLKAACTDETPAVLAALPVGRRDVRLLRLRARTFGSVLESEVRCPACSERLEFSVDVDELLADADEEPVEPMHLQREGYEITFRLPGSSDLLDLALGPEPPEARALLGRCLLHISCQGKDTDVEALPEAVASAVSEAMAEADPYADLHLALACPACGHAWQAPFDVVAYFWVELEGWGQRLLREVHRLARAYGWREADILAMSAWRRQQYLNLLNE